MIAVTHGGQLAVEPRDRAELRRRAGQLALVYLGDELKALAHFQHVLEHDPDDLATQAAVGELLLARQDPEGAYPHLIAAAAGLSDPVRSAELYRAGGTAADRLGRIEDALGAYVEALVRVPTMRIGSNGWGRRCSTSRSTPPGSPPISPTAIT